MKLSEIDYNLPKGLIAHKPIEPRDKCRLMVVKDKIEHKTFTDILNYLNKGDVLVLNETKVTKSKLKGKKSTGSPIEIILINRIDEVTYKARIKINKITIGTRLEFQNNLQAKIIDNDDGLVKLKFNKDPKSVLEQYGEFPFPTYIKRESLSEKEYQTIYANKEGSVAAPTAGLHFTEELLKKITDKGIQIVKIILHIDFGTFFEITEENIEDHKIHEEYFEISKEAADTINNCKGKVVAVGTTCLRALEAASINQEVLPQKKQTNIYIYPGHKFRSPTKALITNFHLPRSTLLLLVQAFAGKNIINKAYQEAIKEKYRFYSLGDAMLLFKTP